MSANSVWQALASLASGYTIPWTQTLLHFLWQGCLVALGYAVLARLLRTASANTRYLAGVVALVGMGMCLPLTFLALPASVTTSWETCQAAPPARENAVVSKSEAMATTSPAEAPAAEVAAAVAATPVVAREPVAVSRATWEPRLAAILAFVAPYATGLYLAGVTLMLLRVCLGLQAGRRLRAACVPVAERTILEMLESHARRLGLRAVPVVAYCQRVSVPVVVGLLRPMILLPVSLATGLTPRQLEAVLVHELAHIHRFDLAIQVLQRFLEAVLFFHPAVWWLSRRISLERENACDDLVLGAECNRLEYAEALVCLAEACLTRSGRAPAPAASVAATGHHSSQFKQRVLRLLGRHEPPRVRLTTGGILVSVALLLAVLLGPILWRNAVHASDEPQSPQATSMSAEAFGKLPLAEQRAVLARAFQRRSELAKSIHFEAEESTENYESQNGKPGKPVADTGRFSLVRYWRLSDSFRMDMLLYRSPADHTIVSSSSHGINAAEGVGRNASTSAEGKYPPQGQVQYPFEEGCYDPYPAWLPPASPAARGEMFEYLFPYLMGHLSACEIQAPVAGGKVQLAVPWQPYWAQQPGGKRVYLLDPQKGFMPIQCDARYDAPPTAEHPMWREEHFVVAASQQVGDIWMPSELTDTVTASPLPDQISVFKTKVLRIEAGTVQPAQLFVPFPEGANIQDILEGATYVSDAQGRPVGEVKFDPNWKQKPPQGWSLHAGAGGYSLLSQLSEANRASLHQQIAAREEGFQPTDAAFQMLKSSAPGSAEQQEAALQVLRVGKINGREIAYFSAIRSLIQAGKPTVPKLCDELDHTEADRMLRALAIVLREIGDPRAVPALIRAIPHTLQAGSGDYGLRIEGDPELQRFMEEHAGGRGGLFNYQTPLRETMAALKKLTAHSEDWYPLRFVSLQGGPEQQHLQRQLFVKLAQGWSAWWTEHWHDFLPTAEEAQLDRIQRALDQATQPVAAPHPPASSSEFPHGPRTAMTDWTRDWLIRSFVESGSQGCWDLDTGRHPEPPAELVKQSTPDRPSAELLAWAQREGVDLITIEFTPPGSEKPAYAFWPVGLKAWRVENAFYKDLPKGLQGEQAPDLSQPWEGPLDQRDAKTGEYDEKATVSFLFRTREGTWGALQLKPPLKGTPYGDGGMEYKFLYEGPAEK